MGLQFKIEKPKPTGLCHLVSAIAQSVCQGDIQCAKFSFHGQENAKIASSPLMKTDIETS
jgi:hypothetical protein